jgi:hypothetical protein
MSNTSCGIKGDRSSSDSMSAIPEHSGSGLRVSESPLGMSCQNWLLDAMLPRKVLCFLHGCAMVSISVSKVFVGRFACIYSNFLQLGSPCKKNVDSRLHYYKRNSNTKEILFQLYSKRRPGQCRTVAADTHLPSREAACGDPCVVFENYKILNESFKSFNPQATQPFQTSMPLLYSWVDHAHLYGELPRRCE